MLTVRMQVQAIADRLAGLPVDVNSRYFIQPWLMCWSAILSANPGQEHEALHQVTGSLPDQKEILQAILGTRPGYVPSVRSLSDIGKELPPIEWVWNGYIPRGLLSILGASQGSGKSFVGLDLAHRIIHNIGFPNGSPIARPGATSFMSTLRRCHRFCMSEPIIMVQIRAEFTRCCLTPRRVLISAMPNIKTV